MAAAVRFAALRAPAGLTRGMVVAAAAAAATARPAVASLFCQRAPAPLAAAVHVPARAFHTTLPAQKVIAFNLADIGEGIAEAEVLQWHVKEGSVVKEFDKLCDVQSDKATVDISSRYDGKIVKLHYATGNMAKVGKPLVDIEISDDTFVDSGVKSVSGGDAAKKADAPAATAAPAAEGGSKLLMTPAVRRLVREHKIDLASVQATGKDNRVLKEDVLKFLEGGQKAAPAPAAAPKAAAAAAPASAPSSTSAPRAPSPTRVTQDRVEPIRGIQRSMVKSMTEALKVPHFGYADEIELNQLVALRSQLKEKALERGVKLSYMPFFIKAASLALAKYPILNAHVNAECTEMTYKASHNIGVAMDTPSGLMVPNVKNVQDKSVMEIAEELNRLQKLGKDGKLGAADLTGGTFSLSNIGVVGGTYLGPVVVVPEVCIGALGRLRKLPRFDDEENVYAAHIMEVSWSADHRVIDGMTVAQFSNLWKSLLENPGAMLLDLR